MCEDKRTIPLSTSQATPLHVLVVASLWTRVVLLRHGHISEDAQQQRLLGNFFCQESHTRNCLVSGVSFCLDSDSFPHEEDFTPQYLQQYIVADNSKL